MADTAQLSPGKIYRKTFVFVLLKLALNMICVFISFGLLTLLYAAVKNQWAVPLQFGILALWALATLKLYPLTDRFGGYLIRAGHIAVISATVRNGEIPASPVAYGIKTVKSRFRLTATYFAVHTLVDKSIKEISKLLWRFASDLSIALNLSMVRGVFAAYTKIAVGSIDDCCIGYTYSNPKKGAMQCACDGVVLYAANWKTMTKCAAATLGWATLICAGFVIVPSFLVLLSMFSVEGPTLWILPILLFSLYVVTAVKDAVIDSYVLCRMTSVFSRFTIDKATSDKYYNELKQVSGKFRNLCAAARKENQERRESRKDR